MKKNKTKEIILAEEKEYLNILHDLMQTQRPADDFQLGYDKGQKDLIGKIFITFKRILFSLGK